MTAPGNPQWDGFVEKFNGKFRDECLREQVFITLVGARAFVERKKFGDSRVQPQSAQGRFLPRSGWTARPAARGGPRAAPTDRYRQRPRSTINL